MDTSTLFAALGPAWTVPEAGLAVAYGTTRVGAIAAFDLDWTLVKPTEKRFFPNAVGDWTWCFGEHTVRRLIELAATHDIVVITNQSDCSPLARHRIERVRLGLQLALSNVRDAHGRSVVPTLMVAAGMTRCRKPMVGAWQVLSAKWRAAGVPIIMRRSFYCGDSAGREDDLSATDALFAHNVGGGQLAFYTPECLFRSVSPANSVTVELPECTSNCAAIARDCIERHATAKKTADDLASAPELTTLMLLTQLRAETKGGRSNRTSTDDDAVVPFTLTLLVGYPGAGKTFFAQRLGQTVVKDVARTDAIHDTAAALQRQEDVVVDGVNATVARRAEFLRLARQAGARCRCVHIATPLAQCRHMDFVRVGAQAGRALLPTAAFNRVHTRFETPTKAEGFDELFTVSNPLVLASPALRKLYAMQY